MRRLGAVAVVTALLLPGPGAVAAPARASGIDGTPLVLLVDVSGSMDENAGNGTSASKLDSAKEGMRNAVGDRSGNLVGIWTYPADGDCSPGGYVEDARPQARSDSSKLKGIIANLYANGNTPTGPALQALGDDLVRSGFPRANIVLVSDGESNCGPPPCDVAQGLVDKGFDITVNTIGFSISDAGREELNCIAGATGGKYVDAENGQELIDELQNQTTPILAVRAASDPQPASPGGPVALTVTATNTSTQMTLEDVNAVVTFRQEGPEDVSLPAVPPRKKLGNLPPGASESFLPWNFSLAGVSGGNKAARYRVVVYGRTTDGVIVDGVITIDTSLLDITPEDWGVTVDGDDQIVIMGDSYSSGQGAQYRRDGAYQRGDCHVSDLSYAQSSPYRVKNLACSGAVVQDLYSPQGSVALPQLAQLASLEVAPKIVLLTLGGNDIKFSQLIQECVQSPPIIGLAGTEPYVAGYEKCLSDRSGEGLYAQTRQSITGLDLASTYSQVWAYANSDHYMDLRGGAYAPVVVLPYPKVMDYDGQNCDVVDGAAVALSLLSAEGQLLAGAAGLTAHYVNADDVRSANEIQVALNGHIEDQVRSASADGRRGIYYASGVEDATAGHGICKQDDSWLVPLSVTTFLSSEAFHPTAEGYRAVGDSLQRYLSSAAFNFDPDGRYDRTERKTYCQLVTQIPSKDESNTIDFGSPEPAQIPFGSPAPTTTYVVSSNNQDLDGTVIRSGVALRGVIPKGSVSKCDLWWVEVELMPGSTSVLRLHSSPVALATLTADEQGHAEALIQIPGWVDPGSHTLTVEGRDSLGNPVVYSAKVSVAEPTPWFVWALGGLVAAALTAASVLLMLWRFRFRAMKTPGSAPQ